MKATEINLTITCDDAGIQEHGAKIIPVDCVPSKGDRIWLEGVEYECVRKEITIDHGMAEIELHLQTVK